MNNQTDMNHESRISALEVHNSVTKDQLEKVVSEIASMKHAMWILALAVLGQPVVKEIFLRLG